MKLTRVFAPLMGAAMVTCGGFSFAADAQVEAPLATLIPLASPSIIRAIRIKNVPAQMMAYWLDPANNGAPPQLQGMPGLAKVPYAAQKSPNRTFALPTGVQKVTAIAPQNALLVFGTETGIAELEKTIAFLDRPLRQIEIEAQFVQISDNDAKAFGIQFVPAQDGQPAPAQQPALGFVRGNVYDTLKALVSQGRAKVLSAPRVTAINNLQASLSSSTSRPAILGFKDEKGQFHELTDPAAQTPGSRLLLGTSFEFTVTPTINNDDTITLLMAPRQVLQLTSEGDHHITDVRSSGGGESIATMHDGDTVALTGLGSNLFAGLENKKIPASKVLVLVTARIIRRMGDEVQGVAYQR